MVGQFCSSVRAYIRPNVRTVRSHHKLPKQHVVHRRGSLRARLRTAVIAKLWIMTRDRHIPRRERLARVQTLRSAVGLTSVREPSAAAEAARYSLQMSPMIFTSGPCSSHH